MDQHLYNETERFIVDSFNKAQKSSEVKHLLRTVYWLKELKPDADETLLVSAVAHDIERAFRQKDVLEKRDSAGYTDLVFLRLHEERGAEIIAAFLKQQGVDDSFIERVKMLISRHEEGGNDDQNLLKDADSVSFFETNTSLFLEKRVPEIGKEKVRQKFDWMFNKITSKKAKQLAEPFYNKAIGALEVSTFQ